MTDNEIQGIRAEIMKIYPKCRVKVTEDKREMVAEISKGYAVAVVERSLPHFHLKMLETYCVLRGTLYVSSGGKGYVLRKADTITIEARQVHFARGAGEPAWIEVKSRPSWTIDDHLFCRYRQRDKATRVAKGKILIQGTILDLGNQQEPSRSSQRMTIVKRPYAKCMKRLACGRASSATRAMCPTR